MDFTYSIWILLLPLISFLVIGLPEFVNKKYAWSHKVAGLIGTSSLGLVTVLSYFTAFKYFSADRLADGTFATFVPYNVTWLPLGHLHFDLGILLDPISVMMLIVISTVSLMVHIYSFGYMHGEKGFQRYYAFLSLFTMSMLGLVLATNIFQMYMFWELVGVSSYLLIGFYYTLKAAVHASKKAFIVTRFADMFFLIGILIFGYYTGSYNFSFTGTEIAYGSCATAFTVADNARALAAGGMILPTALVLMFIGGAGKSAMFPLHIWLPDAMEGPTPVSALIHAATMVVAGVYQVASLFPIWVQYAPETLHYVAYIAAFTAFYAAAVACCQRDIKRGLAFSTISQIAYMLVALGVCFAVDNHHGGLGYMAGIFHLFTHAMFKALLFLCSGAIIVIIGSNFKDYMGGLHKYMPITNICFLIGCLAIAGIPPFAGFFSKDEIITACFQFSPFMGWFMTVVAGMTAFYMFRLYYVIFWGQSYYELDPENRRKPQEVPFVMWGPLVFLAAISCVCGMIPFGHFVSATGQSYDIHIDTQVACTSIVVAIIGIALATYMYAPKKTPLADGLAKKMPKLHKAALNRFYIDDAWQFFTHKIVFGLFSKPIAWFDRRVIDGTFNFMAWGAQEAGETIRPWQSGDVRSYAIWFLTGTVALTLCLLALL